MWQNKSTATIENDEGTRVISDRWERKNGRSQSLPMSHFSKSHSALKKKSREKAVLPLIVKNYIYHVYHHHPFPTPPHPPHASTLAKWVHVTHTV